MGSSMDEAKTALDAVRNFSLKSLPRVEELGSIFSFASAIETSEKIVKLYRAFPDAVLNDLPDQNLLNIKQYAQSVLVVWDQMLIFESTKQNAIGERDSLIQQLDANYISQFSFFVPLIRVRTHYLR